MLSIVMTEATDWAVSTNGESSFKFRDPRSCSFVLAVLLHHPLASLFFHNSFAILLLDSVDHINSGRFV